MFEITILSLIPNSILADYQVLELSLQVRVMAVSGMKKDTRVSSGRSFHWHEKFQCSEDQKGLQFEVLRVRELKEKESMGKGVYDFHNTSSRLITSHERQVGIYDNGYAVGVLYILVQYVEEPWSTDKFMAQTTMVGRSRSSNNVDTSPKSREVFGSQQSIHNKVYLPSLPRTQQVGKSRKANLQSLVQESLDVARKQKTRGSLLHSGISLSSRLPKRNIFSCLDNCTDEWQLAPQLLPHYYK